MADSGLYNSDNDNSSVYDEGEFEEESLDGFEGVEDGLPDRQEEASRGPNEHTRTASQAAKAIEAAEEQNTDSFDDEADNVVAAPSQDRYVASARRAAWEDDMPVLDAGPAPPDYFAATAWRRSSPANAVERRPDILATLQARQPSEELLRAYERNSETLAREEEALPFQRSFGGDAADTIESQDWRETGPLETTTLDETAPLLGRSYVSTDESESPRRRAKRISPRRRWCVLYALFVTTIILVATIAALAQDYTTSKIPRHPNRHGNPALDHPTTANCKFDSYSNYTDFYFGELTSLWIIDDIETGDHFDGPELKDTRVTGNVELVYVPQNSPVVQNSSIMVRAHMATVLPWKVEMEANVSYRKYNEAIVFGPPKLRRSSMASTLLNSNKSPLCLDVLILIYVREGTVLERWDTSLFSLNLIDHERAIYKNTGLPGNIISTEPRLFITNRTAITLHRGDIDLKWRSNDTQLTTFDGSITGDFRLGSYMELYSENGNIDCSISSAVGDENAIGSVLTAWERKRKLRTMSTHGHTKVRVQQPSTHQNLSHLGDGFPAGRKSAHTNETMEDGFLDRLLSEHYSLAGSVSLDYPSRWSGNVTGCTYHGDVSISGHDVNICSDQENHGRRTVKARKGVGSGRLFFQSENGKAALYIK